MPARYNDQRHHSAESFRNPGMVDSCYGSERAEDSDGSSPGRLNPASSHDSISHTRCGSTDSLDTPSIGSHSRQSSGSVDSMNTVTSGTSALRKSSLSSTSAPAYDPMQFVKTSRSTMSLEASAQLRRLEQVQQSRKKVQLEDEEWQSELSSWKSKRMNKSAGLYQRRDELEETQSEDDSDKRKQPMKTYREIVEDRKGRKTSLNFYPMDDEDLSIPSAKPSDMKPTQEQDETRSPVHVPPKPGQKYEDLDVTITQAPDNPSGFGFTIKGGKDKLCPIVIDTVTPEKTKVKLADTSSSRLSLSFEAHRALPGSSGSDYSHGIRRRSAGMESIGRPSLVNIPFEGESQLEEKVEEEPVFKEDSKPDMEQGNPDREREVETVSYHRPLLSSRFSMPSQDDRGAPSITEEEEEDYNSEDEKLEQEIMNRLEQEAKEEQEDEAGQDEVDAPDGSILTAEEEGKDKNTDSEGPVRDDEAQAICDFEEVPTCKGTSSEENQSAPVGIREPLYSTPPSDSNSPVLHPVRQDDLQSPVDSESPSDFDNECEEKPNEWSRQENVEKPLNNILNDSFKSDTEAPDYSKVTFTEKIEIEKPIEPITSGETFSKPSSRIEDGGFKTDKREIVKPEKKQFEKPTSYVPPQKSNAQKPFKKYSFLEKFASEDDTDSEKDSYKSASYTTPYLDKYVKELDQQKEFESLLDFDSKPKDDSETLKTYSLYEGSSNELFSTSKPKPYPGLRSDVSLPRPFAVETSKPKPYPEINTSAEIRKKSIDLSAGVTSETALTDKDTGESVQQEPEQPSAHRKVSYDASGLRSDMNNRSSRSNSVPRLDIPVARVEASRQEHHDSLGDKKVPSLDSLLTNKGAEEEKMWEALEKPTQKKLPWQQEYRKFSLCSIDSLLKDSPRGSNTGSGADSPTWRPESPLRQSEKEESTARWAEAASSQQRMESANYRGSPVSIDSPSLSQQKGMTPAGYRTSPVQMESPSKIELQRSVEQPNTTIHVKGLNASPPTAGESGDAPRRKPHTNRYGAGYKLEDEKKKRDEWKREQERRKQELFAKGQKLRQDDSMEEINAADIAQNDQQHHDILSTELRKLQDLKNGSVPEWAQADRPETDEPNYHDYEVTEKARLAEAEETERLRHEQLHLEDRNRQKDAERKRIAQEHMRKLRQDEEQEKMREMEKERKRKLEWEKLQKDAEAQRKQHAKEMEEWQRKQEEELKHLREERERLPKENRSAPVENNSQYTVGNQRPDSLPVQQRNQPMYESVPEVTSQGHPVFDNHGYSAVPSGHKTYNRDESPSRPDKRNQHQPPYDVRHVENGRHAKPQNESQARLVPNKGEYISTSPLIGRRDVRSPKTNKKGPISAQPITKDEIQDRSIPLPVRRDNQSPMISRRYDTPEGGLVTANKPASPQNLHGGGALPLQRQRPSKSGDRSPQMSRKGLLDLEAVPKSHKLDDWIQPKHQKSTSVPAHSEMPAHRGYWLVEEAERRRQADRSEMDPQKHSGPPYGHYDDRFRGQDSDRYPGQGYERHQGQSHDRYQGQGHPRLMNEQLPGGPFYQPRDDRSPQAYEYDHSRPYPDDKRQSLPKTSTSRKPPQTSHSPHSPDYASYPHARPPQPGPSNPNDYGDHSLQNNLSQNEPPRQQQNSRFHPGVRPDTHSQPNHGAHRALPQGQPPAKPPRGETVPNGASVAEPVISVSGKHRCSHCNKELGQGAAMVIESLQLYYHVQCFRCCVCHTRLGTGQSGADVRVRVNRLHCQNCYSNDEGMKYSCV